MSDWAGLAWLVVLLAANAFFVGAEFAVISAKRSQIEPRAEAGGKAARNDGTPYRVDEWDRRGLIAAASPAVWQLMADRLNGL